MIKFRCKNCGQKISVPENHAGKKGKCPKCKSIVVVPKIKAADSLKDQINPAPIDPEARERSPLPGTHLPSADNWCGTGKQQNSSSPVSDIQLEKKPPGQTRTNKVFANGFEVTQYDEKFIKIDQPEKPPVRKLPWLLDILLYPTSASGMVHLAILSFLPRMLLPLGHLSYWLHPPIFGLGLLVIFLGYLFYCLSDCIRDSANGGLRAPNIDISPTVLFNAGELISPVFKVFICTAVCLGPLLAYFIITRRTNLIFWLLVTYGVIFFPMVLLATVLFDSLRALNPILIIPSTVTVFLPYCGLVLLFFAVGGLIATIISILPQSRFIGYILGAVCIDLAMVAAHLLGRFYYLNSKKLNWEV